ncbi:type I secretion system permease/ATPase [Phyllobacterium sp. YR531]|uniref:type I secretion system permease/ATPase n=1 Tax=Phyllobacterium sp. YR531 TaxID=1144343 RepID=UPI00026F9911|nr:type I secretion system permease/ATPase [Phyllobacterium sp. YR531]EJM99237.1 type I secretion system ABC transporter, PrtD family [Phyllobacterium sp. YR531]
MRSNQLSFDPKKGFFAAIASFHRAFAGIGVVSGVINLLTLTGSFYMLQVYDRVVPGRSVPTLVALSVLAVALYTFQGLLEWVRSRLLVRIASALDLSCSRPVYLAMMRLPLRTKLPGDGGQPIRDLDQVRGFLAGSGPSALFDVPWMPIYIFICFLFHFWIGVTALGGAIVLFILILLAEVQTEKPIRIANGLAASRGALAEATRRNAEAVQAMGIGGRIRDRWTEINAEHLAATARASDVAGTLGSIARILRTMLQSGMLGLGAYLVIRGEASGGVMIASSILMGRALAPIDQLIGHWRGFVGARQSWRRLQQLLAMLPDEGGRTMLPAPKTALSVENMGLAAPGANSFIVQDVTFALKAGDGLGVIGPSASGKSTMLRGLAGIWTPVRGTVRLDGAALDQWDPDELGQHIGYLPQDVQLFAGTIAENISRFDPDTTSELIIAAARNAEVHDLIVHLKDGYETRIGESGAELSAGQRQRIALARALYRDPFLVLLDEPNSNLDTEGEASLANALLRIRQRGGIVIVVAHRPSALANLDLLLIMGNGRTQTFGPKNQILTQVTRPQHNTPPLKVVPSGEEK